MEDRNEEQEINENQEAESENIQDQGNQEEEKKCDKSQKQPESDWNHAGKDMEDIIKDVKASGGVVFIKHMNFLKNNSGVVFGDKVDVDNFDIGRDEKDFQDADGKIMQSAGRNVLETEEQLMQWLRKHYNDFEMAFLIALAVFEKSPYLWVYEMAEELFALFEIGEEERQKKQKEKEKMPGKERIRTVGAGLYDSVLYTHMGTVECEFIRFVEPEYAARALQCVWKEFIFTRQKLINWLEEYAFCENYSKADKAIESLAELARLDYYYFDEHVLRPFLSKKNIMADFAAAQIMIQAYQDERYQNNIELQMKHWSTLINFHYSLTALLAGTMGEWGQEYIERVMQTYIKQAVSGLQEGRLNDYVVNIPVFYEIGARRAVYFKSMVSVLHERLTASEEWKYRKEKNWIGFLFLILLQVDYEESQIDVLNEKKNKDMIFVRMCFINNDVKPKLLELWRYIWITRTSRKAVKKLLEHYIYQYGGCGQEQIQYLRQFLYSFQETEAERGEMENFLKKITFRAKRPVKPAERIHYQLDQ